MLVRDEHNISQRKASLIPLESAAAAYEIVSTHHHQEKQWKSVKLKKIRAENLLQKTKFS